MSIITIFGHEHFKLKFNHKIWYFSLKDFNWVYKYLIVIKLLILKADFLEKMALMTKKCCYSNTQTFTLFQIFSRKDKNSKSKKKSIIEINQEMCEFFPAKKSYPGDRPVWPEKVSLSLWAEMLVKFVILLQNKFWCDRKEGSAFLDPEQIA